ncbi:MAG: mechanosensitive ion channel [Chitinophagaceae bacterium]|nr:MAG: mechanosensitive ion channel [Chitinophagaceae bacterium]
MLTEINYYFTAQSSNMTKPILRIPALLLVLLCCIETFSQDSLRRFTDSSRRWENDSSRRDTSRRRNRDMSLFMDTAALTTSDYQLKIENNYTVLERIHDKSELGPAIAEIRDNLEYSDSSLAVLKENILNNNQALNLRNLQMFRTLLSNIQDDVARQRTLLDEKEKDLNLLRVDMKNLMADTTLRTVMRDSAYRILFGPQLKEMRESWRGSTSELRKSIGLINQLQLHNSRNSITTASLLEKVDNLISHSFALVFSKEFNYIWEKEPDSLKSREATGFVKAYQGESKALNYYFKERSGQRVLLLLMGLLIGIWIYRNIWRIRKMDSVRRFASLDLQYTWPHFIAAPLVVLFTVAPLFDLKAPSVYIESMQFLLLLTITYLCFRKWPRKLFYFWSGIGILFICFSFTHHILQPGLSQRLWLIVLNVLSILLGSLFLRGMRGYLQMKGFLRFVIILHNVMNVLAILCNVFGRFSLAQILGNAAIFSLTQAIGLAIFSRICMEAILLQIEAGRVKQGARTTFDYSDINKGFRGPISFLVVTLWLIVFTTNLNTYHIAREAFSGLMTAPRNLGSASFTIGGVLLFFIIIWLAHLLQKYVGYFFGDTGAEAIQNKRQRSQMLIARLIVLCVGYLLAVAASGLPVDKITIVLGALGVGIGLGLQNIVNNFVSGIILIFDRPLQVGDSISIADKEGTVREIGLRSTTLLTDDGAEVIIPNGDILSLHITNWTLSNNQQRIGILLKLEGAVDMEKLSGILKSTAAESGYSPAGAETEIIFSAVRKNRVQIRFYFWCSDMNDADEARSAVVQALYEQLGSDGVWIK